MQARPVGPTTSRHASSKAEVQIVLWCKTSEPCIEAMDMLHRRPGSTLSSSDNPAQPVGTVPQVMSPNGVQGGILDGEVAGPAYGAVDTGLMPNGVSPGDQTVASDGGRRLDASGGQPDLGQTIGHELVQLEPVRGGQLADLPQNLQPQQGLHVVQAEGAFQAQSGEGQMRGAEWTAERHVFTRTAGSSSPTTMMRWLTRITEVLRTTTDAAGDLQGRVLGGLGLTPGQGVQGSSHTTPTHSPPRQQPNTYSSNKQQQQQQQPRRSEVSPPEELRMPMSWTGETNSPAFDPAPLFGAGEMRQLWDGVRRAPLLYGQVPGHAQQQSESTGSSELRADVRLQLQEVMASQQEEIRWLRAQLQQAGHGGGVPLPPGSWGCSSPPASSAGWSRRWRSSSSSSSARRSWGCSSPPANSAGWSRRWSSSSTRAAAGWSWRWSSSSTRTAARRSWWWSSPTTSSAVWSRPWSPSSTSSTAVWSRLWRAWRIRLCTPWRSAREGTSWGFEQPTTTGKHCGGDVVGRFDGGDEAVAGSPNEAAGKKGDWP